MFLCMDGFVIYFIYEFYEIFRCSFKMERLRIIEIRDKFDWKLEVFVGICNKVYIWNGIYFFDVSGIVKMFMFVILIIKVIYLIFEWGVGKYSWWNWLKFL